MPTPTVQILATIRRILSDHNRLEEGLEGLYALCDRLPAAEMESLLEALQAAPSVRVMQHSDSPAVMKTLEGALGRAGYCLEPIPRPQWASHEEIAEGVVPMTIRHPRRLPLLALGMVALLTGLWAGLARLGWDVSVPRPGFSSLHGPLMVSGFLGTLISLERAVALGQPWAYAAPLLTGLGALVLIAGGPLIAAQLLILGGSAGLVAIFVAIIRRHPALYTLTMGGGAAIWLIGNVLWCVGRPLFHIVFWWAAFLLVTIAGERLELARLQQVTSRAQALFLFLLGILLTGLVLSEWSFDPGVRVTGAGFTGLAVWLSRHDIARRTVTQTGLTRFMAICLLSGYGWLGLSGLAALGYGGVPVGAQYDLILHAFFLGFVFAMIFAHAPVIFPAVLGARMTYRPLFYAHVVLLQITLLIRLGGDVTGWGPGRQVGGLLNAVTLVLFLANTITALRSVPERSGATARARS